MSTFALWRLFHRPGLRGSAGHTSMLAIIAFAAATTIFLTVLGGVHGFIWRASADHTVACAFDFGACRPDTVAAWKRQISDPTSLAQFSTAYVALAVFACMLLRRAVRGARRFRRTTGRIPPRRPSRRPASGRRDHRSGGASHRA